MLKYILILMVLFSLACGKEKSTTSPVVTAPTVTAEVAAESDTDLDKSAPISLSPITVPEPIKKEVAPLKSDRCNQYRQDVRKYVEMYFGLNFPWHYQMGCMQQESNCRKDIVSFDGGIGLFQLTPSTGIVVDIQKDLGVIIDPYNPKHNIRAAVYYLSKIKSKYSQIEKLSFGKNKVIISTKKYTDTCGVKLSDIYQFYNGGYWFYYEASKAGYSCDRKVIRTFCTRGGAWTDKAKTNWLSFCEVNYSYPEQIERRGLTFKMFEFPDYKYW